MNARRLDSSDSTLANATLELHPGDYRLTISGVGDSQDYGFRLLDFGDATSISMDTVISSSLNRFPNEPAKWVNGVSLAGSATNGAMDISSPTDAIYFPSEVLDGATNFTV